MGGNLRGRSASINGNFGPVYGVGEPFSEVYPIVLNVDIPPFCANLPTCQIGMAAAESNSTNDHVTDAQALCQQIAVDPEACVLYLGMYS